MQPYKPTLKPFARNLRSNLTDAEQRLWSKLRRKQILGVQFYRQKPLANYIVDFYCAAANLVIELDGSQHFEPDHQASDAKRDRKLESLGLRVLRFDNRQVMQELDAVMRVVFEAVEKGILLIPPDPPFSKGGGVCAETPGVASDKKQNVEAPTSKTPLATPPTTIPPFEKGGDGGIPRGGIIPKEPGWIHHLDIWTTAETEKKSGRGRSSGNGVSVYGIKKLRELILELAVRGKLVPQDPNDEPAGELLKRIQVEKAKLIAEGKIKKDKPMPPISDEEKSFELPQGWAYSYLGDSVEIIRGITFPGSEKSKVPDKGRVACLRTSNIQDQIEWNDLLYIGEEFVSREDQFLMPRDIVMSMANSRELVGKVALVGEEIPQKTSFGGFLGVLRPFLIEPRFVMSLLRTPHTREELIDSASQTTNIANISLAKLRPLFFAIPPLPEQHRIVDKVDELMALCDQLETRHINAAEAHEKLVSHLLGTLTQSQNADDFSANWQRIAAHFDTLFTTEASIDALKQTLLQLAVMGKLVPQDPNDEPASELLKRIQAEKARLVAEGKINKGKSPLTPLLPRGETDSAAATSINPTTTTLPTPPLSNSTPNPNLNPPFEKGGPGGIQRGISEEEKPFELPQGWEWVRMAEICRPITSGSTPSAENFRYEGGVPFLKVYNIRNQSIDFDYKKQFVEESIHTSKLKRSIIYPGDVVMNIVGPPLGKVAIIPNSYPEWNCNQAIVFFGLIKPMSPQYILTFLKESSFLGGIELIGTAGQDNISVTKSQNIPVAIPPLEEQHRIVTKVDELMSLCDQLKSAITQASQLQKKLADAVVEQAIAS